MVAGSVNSVAIFNAAHTFAPDEPQTNKPSYLAKRRAIKKAC